MMKRRTELYNVKMKVLSCIKLEDINIKYDSMISLEINELLFEDTLEKIQIKLKEYDYSYIVISDNALNRLLTHPKIINYFKGIICVSEGEEVETIYPNIKFAKNNLLKTIFVLIEQFETESLAVFHKTISNLSKVVFIGAGIVNLLSAYELSKMGIGIEIFDSKKNPLNYTGIRHNDLGSTFGGKDGRIFSYTETGHNFNCSQIENNQFNNYINNDGRISTSKDFLNEQDIQWINNFNKIPFWLYEKYNLDHVEINRQCYIDWLNIFSSENIKEDIGFNSNLIKVYSSKEKFDNSLDYLKKNEEIISIISNNHLLKINPILKYAVDNNYIYNSVRVKGFSINIHQLGNFLIKKIETNGGVLHWNKRAEKIKKTKQNKIIGIELENGQLINEKLIIISPGAYGKDILNQLGLKGKINSMIGMWLKLPNIDGGLTTPIKLSREGVLSRGACSSSNIIIGKNSSQIYISSGHGFIGNNQIVSKKYIDILKQGVLDVSEKYFNSSFKENEGELSFCIRPWTYNGLGIFSKIETTEGQIIVTGGHNTGGFAQSPAVSKAIINIILNKKTSMEKLNHPDRGDCFIKSAPSFAD